MTHNKLRLLAIRMAMDSIRGFDVCRECGCESLVDVNDRHASDCPIAELEAEEAASKAAKSAPTSMTLVHRMDGRVDVLRAENCVSTEHEARPYNPEKPAPEFEGEY